jgi:hypothetical protein
MRGSISSLTIASILFSSLTLFGCSSGGGDSGVAVPLYSGNTSAAAITLANAEEMARKSTEGVNESVNLTTTGEGIPFLPSAVEVSSSNDALAQKVRDIAIQVLDGTTTLNLPAAAVLTSDDLNAGSPSPIFCGGSVSVPDNVDQNAPLNFSMTFNNLCFDDGITALVMNGSLVFAETATSMSISFTNFSVNIDGTAETFSGIFSCDTTLSNCTISTDYAGSDGNVYRLANVDISGDALSGYSVSATFYHHTLGQVVISTTLTISYSGACGIYPDGGEIMISGTGGSSMTVTFINDCTFTIQGTDGGSSFGPVITTW